MSETNNFDTTKIIAEKAMFIDDTLFALNRHQMLYVEPQYNSDINRFLAENIDSLCEKYKIVYLPHEFSRLPEILHYSHPDMDVSVLENGNQQPQDFYNKIFENRDDKTLWVPDTPVLLRYEFERNGVGFFTIFPLHFSNNDDFAQLLANINLYPYEGNGVKQSSTVEDLNIRCSSIREGDHTSNRADLSSINELAQEIRDRIEKLKMMGLPDYLIRQKIALPGPKLSPLCITSDFRIVLPDYDNMEISMPTLSKVVYFFYLNHPEGVTFKDLKNYRDELMTIYCRLSNRNDLDIMEQSIDELTDSSRNSINEKVSRIRAAFVSRFDDSLARNYYITLGAGRAKTIILDRSLVKDETNSLSLGNPWFMRTFINVSKKNNQ
jgi:hypothetical protein